VGHEFHTVTHGYPAGSEGPVWIAFAQRADLMEVTYEDAGPPFDPLAEAAARPGDPRETRGCLDADTAWLAHLVVGGALDPAPPVRARPTRHAASVEMICHDRATAKAVDASPATVGATFRSPSSRSVPASDRRNSHARSSGERWLMLLLQERPQIRGDWRLAARSVSVRALAVHPAIPGVVSRFMM
jgi:hypothetical protein